MSKTELGGQLEAEQMAGRRYEVLLDYSVRYRVEVFAGHEDEHAIEQAELRRLASDVEPADRELIHTEVEAKEDIYADDYRAENCHDLSDGPTAPSAQTFWDDSVHFSEETRADYSTEPEGSVDE